MSSVHRDSLSGLSVEVANCPDNIIVIGGGRWARVLIKTICNIVDKSVNIFIYSRSNASFMREWVEIEKIDNKIQVLSSLPEKFSSSSNAVIVVNAARDHAETAAQALSAGGNVMVEKPLTLSYPASQNLVTLSKKLGQNLVAAHIFLFSRYFEKFSKLVSDVGNITSVTAHWVDPKSEHRYGESKQYDSALPVFADWLPHILPMIGTLLPGKSQSCITLDVRKGGAYIDLHLMAGEIPCRVILERDGDGRKRFMEVLCGDKILNLDFSLEPGIIMNGLEEINGDPEWQTGEKPSATMLRAFFKGAVGMGYDSRLDVELGLSSTKVIDQSMDIYLIKQIEWLIEKLESEFEPTDKDLHYALCEIFQIEKTLTNEEIDGRIRSFNNVLLSNLREYWLKELRENKDRKIVLQMGSI